MALSILEITQKNSQNFSGTTGEWMKILTKFQKSTAFLFIIRDKQYLMNIFHWEEKINKPDLKDFAHLDVKRINS